MKAKPTVILLVIALTSFATAVDRQAGYVHAWWQTGHTIVASRAVGFLPDARMSFFTYYELLVNETSVYPDSVYKDIDPDEDFRHYVDLEIWSPTKPETGTLPMAVEQYAAEMSKAIESSDWNRLFLAAGRVAHYVADIHQPYHSTVNYNPRNKAGSSLHGVLDASLERHVSEFRLVERSDIGTLEPVKNITDFMFHFARQSHSFLYAINHTLIDEGKSWSPELTGIIENRTNTAIVSLARVWYTAIEKAGVRPPVVPTPNRLRISLETEPQQVDPNESFVVSFTVADGLGIRTILQPEASVGNLPLSVQVTESVEMPFGRYVAIITPDILQRCAGSSLILNIVAERIGYEPASAQLQIEVSKTQTSAPQTPLAMILVAVAVVLLGGALALAVLRRSRRARKVPLH